MRLLYTPYFSYPLAHTHGVRTSTENGMNSNKNGVSKSEWNANKYSNKNRLTAVNDKNQSEMEKTAE